jgi:N-methylhydantoinase A/oxoprolinase/acetone carboxylase beta subunit
MRGEGFPAADVTSALSLLLQLGDGRIDVPLGAADDAATACARAADAHPGARLREVVLDLRAPMPTWTPVETEVHRTAARPRERRDIRWSVAGPPLTTPILRLEEMAAGDVIEGPAVVETDDTSYAVNPGWTATRSGVGNVVIERADAPAADVPGFRP